MASNADHCLGMDIPDGTSSWREPEARLGEYEYIQPIDCEMHYGMQVFHPLAAIAETAFPVDGYLCIIYVDETAQIPGTVQVFVGRSERILGPRTSHGKLDRMS